MINLCILKKRKTFLKLGFGNQDISRVSRIKGLPHFSCSLHITVLRASQQRRTTSLPFSLLTQFSSYKMVIAFATEFKFL